MRKIATSVVLIALLFVAGMPAEPAMGEKAMQQGSAIQLPKPDTKGTMPLESTLQARRSQRDFDSTPLTLQQKSQLLWAGQGITSEGFYKTAPSAGALYPLTLFAIDESGIYKYMPQGHRLMSISTGDQRNKLAGAALGQEAVAQAPLIIAIVGREEITARKYGMRAARYMYMEAGHTGQNILLQAVAMDLGAVPIGAFHDDEVLEVLGLSKEHSVLYLIPVGKPR